MHAKECKNSRRQIIQDDSSALGKSLQLPYWGRLENIEGSKKYKTGKESFPFQRNCDQSEELSRDFVDDHKLGVLYGGRTGDAGGGRYADRGDQNSKSDSQRSSKGWRNQVCNCSPKHCRSA